MEGIRLNENVNERELEDKIIRKDDDDWSGLSVCQDEFLVVNDKKMKWFTMNGECKKEIEFVDLDKAWNVEVCEGEVYVSDYDQRAVFVLDRGGRKRRMLCLPVSEKGLIGKLGLAIDRVNKDIYVCSELTNTVYKYDKGKKEFIPWITDGLDKPWYLCVNQDCHLVVSGVTTVTKYNPQRKLVWSYGNGGHGEGQLAVPHGVSSDPSGDIFIADNQNHRIVVVSSDGKHLFDVNIKENIESPQAVSFRNGRLVITTGKGKIYVIKEELLKKPVVMD